MNAPSIGAAMVLLTLIASSAGTISPASTSPEQAVAPNDVGLAVGAPAPRFQARDQFGSDQTERTVAGKNGTVLLFFRSADW